MDRAELERQLEHLHTACWGWALACCGRDRDAAEETLQTAYLKVLSGKAQFDGRSAVRTWLFGVIRHTAHEELRRRAVRGLREEAADELIAATNGGADAETEKEERSAKLVTALSKLSPRQREVLTLVFYHEMTIEEAAEVMQISLGSARTHYDRGKKMLAREMTQ